MELLLQGKGFGMIRNKSFGMFLAVAGLLVSIGPAAAQGAAPPKWKPSEETITISAMPDRDWRALFTGSHISSAIAVSASIPVPYSDLNLVRDADAAELDRRIGVAAQIVCHELDLKYPRAIYVSLGSDDCVGDANRGGLSVAHNVVAAARK
jgi:UrcA family protein